MAINDKERYSTNDPTTDIPGLGANPDLKPLNKQLVRQQLSMIETDSIPDRERAIHILLSRIRDYYEVIGYVGPQMSGRSELGLALGEWLQEPNHEPWRESFCTTNKYHWEKPEKIFNGVRYACFESSLLLAAWEIGQEIPESQEALKRAAWAARNAIQQHCGRYWPDIRNRNGTKGMRKVLATVLSTIEGYRFIEGQSWLGYFVDPGKVAA